ncbi:MAG TPA: hypothetical protein VII56_12010 [Rhizomicrobium sp.]
MDELSVFFYVTVILFALPLVYAIRIAKPEHELILGISTSVAIIAFLLLLYVVNEAIPFAGGGDDELYFDISNIGPDSIESAFGVIAFYAQQPGYGFLLMVVDLFVHGLYLKKALNVSLFVLDALMWYRIGLLTANRKIALRFFFAVLFATPLMHYFLFLFKDMTITIVQTALLLWTLDFIFTERRRNLLLIFFGFLMTVMLRLPAVLLEGAMVAGVLFFYRHVWFARWQDASLTRVVVGIGMIAGAAFLYVIVTNSEFIQLLGIAGTRSFGDEGLSSQVGVYLQKAQGSPLFIVPVFFLITLNGLYALSRPLSADIIEGLSALPWIYVGLPLFLWSAYYFLGNWRAMLSREKALYLSLFFITALFLAQSIVVFDTTRWRMPGIPVMFALSALGWTTLGNRRGLVLATWAVGISLLLGLYYFTSGG